ncbi:trans-aconitate 2-methyltransferase [Microvirga brassicacearum]|uniref:Trans-aconitate 2-methyltransferase n=1 Tax=Microvirga brassicacearum TaxID=2580413 RepID=A0A5N3PFG5_9HYPH|nr:trans-aconitate 2-methyltransferase [Microvirga brassicacearum]
MADWNADQYLKFEDERTRPSTDLLRRVPLAEAERCVDLGCGPGNSTALLAGRFPVARITGLDSSAAMVAAARERLPDVDFQQMDLQAWEPTERFDLIFANAVLQWLPNHAGLLPRLVSFLKTGGVLAVQMPNNLDEPAHRLMTQIAKAGPWAGALSSASAARSTIGSFEDYYACLQRAGCNVDIWQTTYIHVLDGPGAIVEWFRSTGLKPYLDPLPDGERANYLALYEAAIAEAYPAQGDGKVLLRFPRLFFVAQRR